MALTTQPPSRPIHLRPSLVALVVLGGTIGTALRNLVETTFGAQPGQFPWATLAINLSGAFLLGLLVEALLLAVPAGARRRAFQLTLGTGLLGGYTTYGTFVLEIVGLGVRGDPGAAVGYASVSVVAGAVAAFLGMRATRLVLTAAGGAAR